MTEILNSFKYHRLQNDFFHENKVKLESNGCKFVILSLSAFNSDFANFATFFSKSALSMNPAIADLPANSFWFIFASSVSLVNLL